MEDDELTVAVDLAARFANQRVVVHGGRHSRDRPQLAVGKREQFLTLERGLPVARDDE